MPEQAAPAKPDIWVPAPELAEQELSGSFWSFGALGCEPYTPFLVLAPDGLIGNYQNQNEDLWQIQGGRLGFMSDKGVPTTLFHDAQLRDGRVVALAGRVLIRGPVIYHELRRRRHPAHPIHATPPEQARKAVFHRAIPAPQRPNLVILRAGDESCHPKWPRDLPAGSRNWDLCISSYGSDSLDVLEPAEYTTHQPHQRKFQAIHDLFFPGSPLWNYERIWLPDDDLMVGWAAINRMFHIARKYALDLAQPALLPVEGCFITHGVTAWRPDTILRYVDFVELMCPAFSTRALRVCLGTFRDSVSGFGLDHLWPALLGGGRSRIAIIDAAALIHTRPLGANYDIAAAVAEEAALLAAYRLSRFQAPPLAVNT